MKEVTDYTTTMWAEMSPDLYGGDDCETVQPQFEVFSVDDMESERLTTLTLEAAAFLPGTKIKIEIPCCPHCGMDAEYCSSDSDCDFSWDDWRDNKYC